MAARSVDWGEDVLVEVDERFGYVPSRGEGIGSFCGGGRGEEVGIFAPGFIVSWGRKGKGGQE
jgi:hypothetical protein